MKLFLAGFATAVAVGVVAVLGRVGWVRARRRRAQRAFELELDHALGLDLGLGWCGLAVARERRALVAQGQKP